MAMRRSTRMMLGRAANERQLPGRKMEIEYERWGEPEDRYDREPRSNWREPVRMGGYEEPLPRPPRPRALRHRPLCSHGRRIWPLRNGRR